MATGLIKNLTVVGIMEETTEGTYVAPAAATNYMAPLSDGFEITPSRELLDRQVLSSALGKATPKQGMKSVDVALPVEFRASGTEGGDVDFGLLLESALGATRTISTTTTTKSSGNTGSTLAIEDADISKFNVGDIICVKQSAGHHVAAVTAKVTTPGSASLGISPGKASGSFSNSVVISKSQMYYAGSSHPSLSVSIYHGNEITEKAWGCKVTSLSIDNYTTGQLASFNFGLTGLDFSQENGAAPHTPSFDSGTPPVILSATVFKDGTALELNQFAVAVANTLSPVTNLGSSAGKTAQRVTARSVTGTINPFKDDTSVANYTAFEAGTTFSLLARAYIPSSTSGEMTMGSIVAIYLPTCIITGLKTGEQEGVLTDDIEFTASGGADGSSAEIYIGLI